jgi:hypothetical protein
VTDAAEDITQDNPPILLGSPIGIYRGGQRECTVFLPAPTISTLMEHVGELAAELGADSLTMVTGTPHQLDLGQLPGRMHFQLVAATAEQPYVHTSITAVAAGPTPVYSVLVQERFTHPLVDVDSFTATYLSHGHVSRRPRPRPAAGQLENAGATVTPGTVGTAELLGRSTQKRQNPDQRRYDTDFADLMACSAASIAAAKAEAKELGACRPRIVLACQGDPVLNLELPNGQLSNYGTYIRLSALAAVDARADAAYVVIPSVLANAIPGLGITNIGTFTTIELLANGRSRAETHAGGEPLPLFSDQRETTAFLSQLDLALRARALQFQTDEHELAGTLSELRLHGAEIAVGPKLLALELRMAIREQHRPQS